MARIKVPADAADAYAEAVYATRLKKRKIKAAQARVKEIKTGVGVPMNWGMKADYESYLAETAGGRVPKRNMRGETPEERRRKG